MDEKSGKKDINKMPDKIILAATFATMRNAHKWEPFPLYKPSTFKNKIHWRLIKFRWFCVKRFVKTKSFFNGKTKY